MLLVFSLLKWKQINDLLLNQTRRVPIAMALPRRLLNCTANLVDYFILKIQPDDRTMVQLKKAKQQSRYNSQGQFFNNL